MTNNRVVYAIGATVLAGVTALGGYYFSRFDMGAGAIEAPVTELVDAKVNGPTIPGLCVLSQNALYANAKVGQAATARYRQLAASLQAQLQPERVAIQDDAKKLEGERTSLPPLQFQQQQQALAERLRALQAKTNFASRELEGARIKMLKQIAALANPVVIAAYKNRHCGALFSREAMLVGNPSMDLTAEVVHGLDARVTTIAFALDQARSQSAEAPTPN